VFRQTLLPSLRFFERKSIMLTKVHQSLWVALSALVAGAAPAGGGVHAALGNLDSNGGGRDFAQVSRPSLKMAQRTIEQQIETIRKNSEELSKPLVGKAPPVVLPPTREERLQREKERAVERSIRDDAISTDKKVLDRLNNPDR
jgi:hypothetical protein